MKTFKLHLIRHGFTQANLDGAYCGSTDLPLCPAGEQRLYSILEENTYPFVDAVYASPMLRARQTARILYPEHDPILVEDMRESSFGPFEGRTLAELRTDAAFNRWVTPGSSECPAGVEKPEAFFRRCCEAFLWVADDMLHAGMHSCALVTHAGVIGNILAQFAYPKQAPYDWQCEPGRGFTVLIDPTIFLRNPVVEVIGTVPPEPDEPAEPDEEDRVYTDAYGEYAAEDELPAAQPDALERELRDLARQLQEEPDEGDGCCPDCGCGHAHSHE